MISARTFAAQDYLGLKTATRLLNKAVGGLEAAESLSRGDHSTHGRYQSPNTDLFIPVDVVVDLEHAAEVPFVTRALAALNGHLVIPKPPVHGDPRWLAHMAEVSKECGDAIARLAVALADDGAVSADESRRLALRREVREAMEAMASLDKSLEEVERAEARRLEGAQ